LEQAGKKLQAIDQTLEALKARTDDSKGVSALSAEMKKADDRLAFLGTRCWALEKKNAELEGRLSASESCRTQLEADVVFCKGQIKQVVQSMGLLLGRIQEMEKRQDGRSDELLDRVQGTEEAAGIDSGLEHASSPLLIPKLEPLLDEPELISEEHARPTVVIAQPVEHTDLTSR